MSSSAEWMAAQLLGLGASRGPQGGLGLEVPHYNPRPPGFIREGGATYAVLLVLVKRRGVWLSHRQIAEQSGRTGKAVDWALRFLQSAGFLQSARSDARNPRYHVYRLDPAWLLVQQPVMRLVNGRRRRTAVRLAGQKVMFEVDVDQEVMK